MVFIHVSSNIKPCKNEAFKKGGFVFITFFDINV